MNTHIGFLSLTNTCHNLIYLKVCYILKEKDAACLIITHVTEDL